MKYLIPVNISTKSIIAVNFTLIEAPHSLGFLHSLDDIDAVYFCVVDCETGVMHKVKAHSTVDKLCWMTDVRMDYVELHLVTNGELIKYNWDAK